MNLKKEAYRIATEALVKSNGEGRAYKLICVACADHRVAVCHWHAIKFCAKQDTSAGESYLKARCGGMAREEDSFGDIACRVAYATLYHATSAALDDLTSGRMELVQQHISMGESG